MSFALGVSLRLRARNIDYVSCGGLTPDIARQMTGPGKQVGQAGSTGAAACRCFSMLSSVSLNSVASVEDFVIETSASGKVLLVPSRKATPTLTPQRHQESMTVEAYVQRVPLIRPKCTYVSYPCIIRYSRAWVQSSRIAARMGSDCQRDALVSYAPSTFQGSHYSRIIIQREAACTVSIEG